ncbi:hypothetical protein HELRODRAFT_63672, partial [Helobdella robusta]|uniref:Protein VAC14 homolog n=1 Tax=Helobdella robusta TaxID=6412 RepID=T1FXI9_HELRO
IIFNTSDKLYEKRKVAALEIERSVKEFYSNNDNIHLQKILNILCDLTLSQNPNNRKGGLIGLAAFSIALGKETAPFVNDLVKPALSCFYDPDSRVRYYGCESLYNIIKVSRVSVLPLFNDIFDGLNKLSTDPDQNVRSGCELLNRLMKDIVSEFPQFDLKSFIPLLRERLLSNNPYSRQFIVSWIKTLDEIPELDVVLYLSELLDGLFQILGDNSQEIKNMCESCLGEFLHSITVSKRKLDYDAIINILNFHIQSTDKLIQCTAFTWLHEILPLPTISLLPHIAGILTATLPCLSCNEGSPDIRNKARLINSYLLDYITSEKSLPNGNQFFKLLNDAGETSANRLVKCVLHVNDLLIFHSNSQLDLPSILKVLTEQMFHPSNSTRLASISWVKHLLKYVPQKMIIYYEELLDSLLKSLSDESDEVNDSNLFFELCSTVFNTINLVHATLYIWFIVVNLKALIFKVVIQTLELITAFSSRGMQLRATDRKLYENLNEYFNIFMEHLIKLFKGNRQLLNCRGPFIIKRLCLMLNAKNVYCCASDIMHVEDDVFFVSELVQTFNYILLTSAELFQLRNQLKHLDSKENCDLFCCLYKSWCHNPVATIALCLLSQNYKHALNLLTVMSEIEITVEHLVEIDQLIQLIESPIFSYLRLQLLDNKNDYLIKSLYGLLMLLPQSDAFYVLQHRLQCLPHPPLNTSP